MGGFTFKGLRCGLRRRWITFHWRSRRWNKVKIKGTAWNWGLWLYLRMQTGVPHRVSYGESKKSGDKTSQRLFPRICSCSYAIENFDLEISEVLPRRKQTSKFKGPTQSSRWTVKGCSDGGLNANMQYFKKTFLVHLHHTLLNDCTFKGTICNSFICIDFFELPMVEQFVMQRKSWDIPQLNLVA